MLPLKSNQTESFDWRKLKNVYWLSKQYRLNTLIGELHMAEPMPGWYTKYMAPVKLLLSDV